MSPNETPKPTSAEDGNRFAALQDRLTMTDSLVESTQQTAPAPAPDRKQTAAQMYAEMKAKREAIRAKREADAAQEAQQVASEGEVTAAGTPKRPRSPSPETPQKRTRDAMNLDQPTTDVGKAVELTPIQKIRQLNLGDLNFPANTAFKCSMSVDQQPIVGGPIAKGFSINFFIDEGQYGLPHIRLLFKANKPGMLNQDLASRVEDQEEFSICYYPGKVSTHGNEVMIARFMGQPLISPNVQPNEQPNDRDKEVLDRTKNDKERQKLIRLMFKIDRHELRGVVNLDTWMGGLGRSVAANMEKLLTGRYTIAIWLVQKVGLMKALDSFHLALEARVPLLHQYYDSDLLAPVLDLENTPLIEQIGNGMYVIHPKKFDEQGREVRDASQKLVYDTDAPPASFRSLPFVTDWANAEHFMIYNALSVIREYQFQRDQSVSPKITLSTKPALRDLNAVEVFSTSSNPQIQCLRDLLINKADPNRIYPTVDITGGPHNDKKLKELFSHRIKADRGLNNEQSEALKALQRIPIGIHVVEGPPGTGKTTMIANTVWPCVEVGHRVCCFTATNMSADHLANAITGNCPPELKDKLVIRTSLAAIKNLMIKRSSQFDKTPDDEQLQQPPKEQPFDQPEDEDPLCVMGLEQINQAVIENDALFDQMYDEFMKQNTAPEDAFGLLREKADRGGSLNVPLATTLAYRIRELEMQDHIVATKEYDAEYQERTQGLDRTAKADAVRGMRSIEDRSQSSQFKKYREFYINQDGRIYGATKRMFKSLTKDMAMRVMKKVHILIMTANNAGSELAELGFEPTLLICEEGGQANIASFCVPLTVFSGWLACAIFGDKQQLQRDSFGSRFNEVSENGRLSILGLLGHKRFPSHKLDVQYLMDPDIARFPNLRFYQGTLMDGPNTELSNPTKAILRRVSKEKLKIRASTFWMVDVQNGVSYREAGSSSLQNDENAYAIHQQVSMLLDEGIQAHQITILVYYRAQLINLAKLLKRVTADGKIERMCSNITTVDSFHGSHSDVIILDMVAVGRDSWSGKSQVPVVEDVYEEGAVVENAEDPEIGKSRVFAKYTKYTQYAKNCHRLNLACTRAKMGFIVFCHTKSMLATSRITKAGNGTQYEKSDLAALARDAQDRRIVVGVTGNQESPRGSLQQRKRSPYG